MIVLYTSIEIILESTFVPFASSFLMLCKDLSLDKLFLPITFLISLFLSFPATSLVAPSQVSLTSYSSCVLSLKSYYPVMYPQLCSYSIPSCEFTTSTLKQITCFYHHCFQCPKQCQVYSKSSVKMCSVNNSQVYISILDQVPVLYLYLHKSRWSK